MTIQANIEQISRLRKIHSFYALTPNLDYAPTEWHKGGNHDSTIERCRRCNYTFITFTYTNPYSKGTESRTLLPTRDGNRSIWECEE